MPQVKRSPEYFTTGHRETWSGITLLLNMLFVPLIVGIVGVVVYRYRTGFRRKTIR